MKTTSYSATTTGKSLTIAESLCWTVLHKSRKKIVGNSTTFEAAILLKIMSDIVVSSVIKKKVRRKIASSDILCALEY